MFYIAGLGARPVMTMHMMEIDILHQQLLQLLPAEIYA